MPDNDELSGGKPLLRCKFNRWREQILLQYGVDIVCESGGSYRYSIANPECIDEDKISKWMLDSLSVSNTLSANKCLSNRIIVDEIPSGRDHLMPILSAMRENRILSVTYQSFGKTPHTFNLAPYCVKLYQSRWYLLAKGGNGHLWLYGLDRIKDLKITTDRFKLPDDFDAERFFSLLFGVVLGDKRAACPIVLRAYERHADFIRSLPLHKSQEELPGGSDAYTDFKYFMAPTYDFIMKVLSMGSMVEVIKPQSLRDEVAAWVNRLAEMYLHNK